MQKFKLNNSQAELRLFHITIVLPEEHPFEKLQKKITQKIIAFSSKI